MIVYPYESALELNIWSKTQLVEAKWDASKKSWTVVLEREVDGNAIKNKLQFIVHEILLMLYSGTLHPRHVVQATDLNDELRAPEIPRRESFEGKIMHSSQFISP